MLEQIRKLEQAGQWAEIRRQAPALLAGLEGDQLARAHLIILKAFEVTATSGEDYRKVLEHAQAAVKAAVPGSLLHTWALHAVAAAAADLGRYTLAERAAFAFLKAVESHPQAQILMPWVRFALGRAYSRQRRHSEALHQLRLALVDAKGELRERIQITLARAYARAGMIEHALNTCPETVAHVSESKIHAARALIFAQAQDWAGAEREAKTALRLMQDGDRRVYDAIEAAELYLTLRDAATALGRTQQAAVWHQIIAASLSRWNEDVMTVLAPILREKGGEAIAQAASRGLPAGHHRCGLRGTVG